MTKRQVLIPGDRVVPWLDRCKYSSHFKPIKYCVVINGSTLPETTKQDWEFRYIDISSVDGNGNVLEAQSMRLETAPSRARRRLRKADTFISTVRTYLKAIGFCEEGAEDLVCSTGFATLTAGPLVEPKFLFYWARSTHFVDEIVARSVGVSYPAINASEIGSLPVPLLPREKQLKIANFLDGKVTQIDALIDKKQRLIERLQERRTALIVHVVTKGLNRGIEMKDSGIPSIGLVPKHWDVLRNKFIFRERDERSLNEEGELLTVSHITGVTKRSEKEEVYMFLAETLEGYKHCKKGDVAINTMWAWMGALGVSPVDGVISPSYNVYRPIRKICDRYFDLLLRTPAYVCEVIRFSKGIWTSRLRLYPEAFLGMLGLCPPLREQEEISDYLDSEMVRMRTFEAKLRESIDRLAELRSALISAAVTGEISVN